MLNISELTGFREQGPKLSREEVRSFFAGRRLPVSDFLLDFYCSINGGYPEKCLFRGVNREFWVDGFLPLEMEEERLSAEQAYSFLIVERKAAHAKMWPVANDMGAQFYCIDMSNDALPVFLVETIHAKGVKIIDVAQSLEKFIMNLDEE